MISKSKGLKHLVESDSPLAKDEGSDATDGDVVDLINSPVSPQEDEGSDSGAVSKRPTPSEACGEGPSSPKKSRLSDLKVMVKRRQVNIHLFERYMYHIGSLPVHDISELYP